MFSKSLELVLNNGYAQAHLKRHECITVEHLLLCLIDHPHVATALCACGVEIERLRASVGIFLDETTPKVSPDAELGIQPTLSYQRVIQRAIKWVEDHGESEVEGMHVLLAIFDEPESQALFFLNQEGVFKTHILLQLQQGRVQPEMKDYSSYQPSPIQGPINTQSDQTDAEDSAITQYAQNLNKRAMAGEFDPLVGREEEVLRCIQILCRRSKNNPILVGEAGVGKTAIAEGLAQKLVNYDVPQPLIGSTVYSLDLAAMLAGTKYRGDFEKRLKALFKALSADTKAILFIDEIHNLIGAGSATGGTMDAANLMKPMLSRAGLKCIGATTYDEYRQYISKDNALLRRFQKIDVAEPSVEETKVILQGLKSKYEQYHGLIYRDDAIDTAVELSARYITDRFLPDKAIDVIDEAGAELQLQRQCADKVISKSQIENVIAKMAQIPLSTVSDSDIAKLRHLDSRLRALIFGQDSAIQTLTDAIKLSQSGLSSKDKPIGSFLMTGPTGVGKTALSEELAKALGIGLIRFDMSEYMEKHAVARLIGAPPGYVGFEQGGLLTEAISKQPHSVVLLDEIEKAHPDLFNLLLQVMDYGMLTDSNGKKVDCRHIIFIMTSNIGAELMDKRQVGFAVETAPQTDISASLKQVFSPEFRNRLDAVLQFQPLQIEHVLKIINKEMEMIKEQLAERDIKFNISPPAKEWLAERGYDRKMGARPIGRLIQSLIKQPLSEELLFNTLSQGQGGTVKIRLQKGELKVLVEAPQCAIAA